MKPLCFFFSKKTVPVYAFFSLEFFVKQVEEQHQEDEMDGKSNSKVDPIMAAGRQ